MAKLPLLNEIVSTLSSRVDWGVVSDDDVVFESGGLRELLALSAQAGFDLAQPARAESELDYEITGLAPSRVRG